MQQRRLDRRFLRNPVLLFALVTVLLQFPGSRDLLQQPYSGIETLNVVVQNIDTKGPNAAKPIERNDEILSVAGERVRSYNHLRALVGANKEFAPQEYEFVRGADSVTVEVSYSRIPSSIVYRRFGRILVGFTFLLTGLLVLLRRTDSIGILFSLNCTILCYLLSERPVYPQPALQLAGELLDDAVMLAFPAVFLHFFMVFPERVKRSAAPRRLPREALLYVLPFLFFAASTALVVRNFYFAPAPGGALRSILALSTIYMAGYLLASLVVFTRSYRATSTGQKQKLRIAIAGTLAGMVPFLAMIVWRQIMPGGYTIWEFLSSACLAFVSISFAYAIVKHGAIELNIVVRKSIVYAFLTGVIIAAYYGLVRLLGDYVTSQFNLRPVYFSMIAVLVLAVMFAPARQIVQGVVDRLFFRGDYDYRREVVEFNRQLSRKLKKSEILDYFTERMRTLLKASYVAFYKKGDAPRPSRARLFRCGQEQPSGDLSQGLASREVSQPLQKAPHGGVSGPFLGPAAPRRRVFGLSRRDAGGCVPPYRIGRVALRADRRGRQTIGPAVQQNRLRAVGDVLRAPWVSFSRTPSSTRPRSSRSG